MNWEHQTVLVTGAGGFIGSHLTERLVEYGARTRALVHYNSANSWGWLDSSLVKADVEVVQGDLCDPETVGIAAKGVDIIFHLAALVGIPYSYQAPLSYLRTNIEGTLNVMQAALVSGVAQLVHTSTSEVYGSARYVPMDEAHPLQGQSPYSASKIGADKMAEAFHRSFGLPVATVRPFNTYGPRQSARAIIPTIITQALTKPVIRLGNLEPTRDMNYVADTVQGFLCAAVHPQAVGQVINIGSGKETSIRNLAEMILRLLGRSLPIETDDDRVRPIKSEVDRLWADNQRAQELLDWTPQHSLEDGLGLTIEWLQRNIDLYRSGAYVV
jgi:dTDP-glucose 4,6-dehydratase